MFGHKPDQHRDQKSSIAPAPKTQMGGVYEVTLESSSTLGTFRSNGRASVKQFAPDRYEIKAVLTPETPPFYTLLYAITQPYYIRASFTYKESSSNTSIECSGGVYVVKGPVNKTILGEKIVVKFTEPFWKENNEYTFLVEPLSWLGVSPGRITNKGTIKNISSTISDEVKEEVECKYLSDLDPVRRPSFFRVQSVPDLLHDEKNSDSSPTHKTSRKIGS